MKKVFLIALLIAGSAAYALAEHPKAEHPAAAQKAMTPADKVAANLKSSGVITEQEVSLVSASIAFLLENGASADEAEKIVKEAVNQAKAQGVEGEELTAKVQEAAQNSVSVKKLAEHPAAVSEHPAKPKDHPGH